MVKLSHVYDVTGRVEEWHIPGKTASKRVPYRLQTRTVERLSARHQTDLATFLGFGKPLYSCTEGMCHSSTRPTSRYVIPRDSVLPGLSLPLVSQARLFILSIQDVLRLTQPVHKHAVMCHMDSGPSDIVLHHDS